MFDFLGAMICKWKGHRFGHPRAGMWNPDFPEIGIEPRTVYAKKCARCGEVREVKKRKPKVQV